MLTLDMALAESFPTTSFEVEETHFCYTWTLSIKRYRAKSLLEKSVVLILGGTRPYDISG